VPQVVAGTRRTLAQALEHQQRDPVDDQEGRRDRWRGEQFAQGFLKQQSDDADGDRADDEQPAETGVDVVIADLADPQRAEDAFDDPDPVFEEEQQQYDRRGQVGGNQERQEVGRVLVDAPTREPRQHDRVTEARDGKRLGDALRQAEDDRLEVGDGVVHAPEAYGAQTTGGEGAVHRPFTQ